ENRNKEQLEKSCSQGGDNNSPPGQLLPFSFQAAWHWAPFIS
ncbi:rCG26495, partial [Rattus norvegicus]